VQVAYTPSGGVATTAAHRRLFRDLAQQLAERSVQLVSLGCGGGQKDAPLAAALGLAGYRLRYLAVDAVADAAPACKGNYSGPLAKP